MDVRNEILNAHHSLIAGATGSGKSVLLNAVICEGLKRDFDFWFIDLKRVELNQYKKTRNCLAYVTDPNAVVAFLDDIIEDMDEEYERMEARGVKETDRPHRYLVIDELAHMTGIKGALDKIIEIGRLGRAAHIHMIGATQDPSKYTLTAQLMQNITCAVALKCKDATASRQIVGEAGAEMLPPHGKGLISTYNGIKKVTIPYISDAEIAEIVEAHRAPLTEHVEVITPEVVKKTPAQRVASGEPLTQEDVRLLKPFIWCAAIGGIGWMLCNTNILASILSSVLAFAFVMSVIFRRR